MKWVAEFKEEALSDYDIEDQEDIDPDELDYEYSALRVDNEHGKVSWGWGDDDKIIVFGSGVGENPTDNKEWAKEVVKKLVDILNQE